MKNTLLLFGIFLTLGIYITSCGGPAPQEGGEQKEAVEVEAAAHDHEGHDHAMHADSTAEESAEQGPEYTSAYICPMHCAGSGSNEPGKCPVCGMEYVKN